MKVSYQKRFLTDLAKIPVEARKGIEKFVFEEMLKLNSLSESGKIEQMKGYGGYYKARFGSYRVEALGRPEVRISDLNRGRRHQPCNLQSGILLIGLIAEQ